MRPCDWDVLHFCRENESLAFKVKALPTEQVVWVLLALEKMAKRPENK